MNLSEIFFTSVITSISVSGLVSYILQEIWQSNVRKSEAEKNRNRTLCDDFVRAIKDCRNSGIAFWESEGRNISIALKRDVIFFQSMAENKFHLMDRLGFNNREKFLDFLELLTGGDFDDESRPPSIRKCSDLNEISSELCRNVGIFKFEIL